MDSQPDWRTADVSWRRAAWIFVAIADAGFILWGAAAALVPEHLIGPGSAPILPAGYQGFTGGSWSDLVRTVPAAAAYMTLLFRVFGGANVAFGVVASAVAATAFRRGERWAWWALLVGNTIGFGAPMTYDRMVHAIGPFEMLEYVGIAGVYAALAVARPMRPARREQVQVRAT